MEPMGTRRDPLKLFDIEQMGNAVRAERAIWAPILEAMSGLLKQRADTLVGCTEGSPEEAELEAIADVLDAYEAKRVLVS